jgi:hypothetical protein
MAVPAGSSPLAAYANFSHRSSNELWIRAYVLTPTQNFEVHHTDAAQFTLCDVIHGVAVGAKLEIGDFR